MDTLRGQLSEFVEPEPGLDGERDESSARRSAILGGDERRMQVRAYNFWAGLLGDRLLPDVAHLHPETLPDFGPNSILLDFSGGIENPAIAYLGAALADECGARGTITRLSDVPGRSLLSRITDHYLQILANQAPIGFEAEFLNHRDATILYRGILLPFSRDGATIDFIYGVINWKQLEGPPVGDIGLPGPAFAAERSSGPTREPEPLREWADGPADSVGDLAETDFALLASMGTEDAPLDFSTSAFDTGTAAALGHRLACARDAARIAGEAGERSRHALYIAIGRAHDFALAGEAAPDELTELARDAGLAMSTRSPLATIVKLVFGANYDKTRLAEYAAVIAHAQRLGLAAGALADSLGRHPGGIKALVREERASRRAASGPHDGPQKTSAHQRLVARLRSLSPRPLASLAQGGEFTLLVARRTHDGQLVLLGGVDNDQALLGKAARRLLDGDVPVD